MRDPEKTVKRTTAQRTHVYVRGQRLSSYIVENDNGDDAVDAVDFDIDNWQHNDDENYG